MTPTTGQTISRMGVLTVLTTNLVVENRLDADTRRKHRRELTAIVNGQRGVTLAKLEQRCMERCAQGMWN
jgi:hypothetical protein